MAVKPIPEGYHSITPYLAVADATKAIDFYKRAFGAKERLVMPSPDGKVMHAELEFGDSVVMLSDPFPQGGTKSPSEAGTATMSIMFYVEDVDSAYQQALDGGATSEQEPEDMFWGDRFARVKDPDGHSWQLATHVEDVSEEEMERRGREAMAALAT